MVYGVCTWIFGGEPLPILLARIKEMGFDGVELLGDPEKYNSRTVKTLLDDHGLKVFSLTPLNVDLAHPDPDVRRRALDYYYGLLDYASQLGAPLVVCHGQVGRVRPLATQREEEKWFSEGIAHIADRAERMGLRVAVEALNRYESHLLNTAIQAKALVEEIGSSALGILLDTYHMNIEEADFEAAIRTAGKRLYLFHVADSNRRAPGRGHIPFPKVIRALSAISYAGPIIVECTAPGPDPFTPIKGPGWEEAVWDEVQEALRKLRGLAGV